MPNYLIVRGLPALVIVATELISGSWRTSMATGRSFVPWFGIAAHVPMWVLRPEHTPHH